MGSFEVGKTNNGENTSFPEQALYFYLQKLLGEEVVLNRVLISARGKAAEYDIYLCDRGIVIEYNGEFYHRERRGRDQDKHDFALSLGLRVVSITESDKNRFQGDEIFIKCDHGSEKTNLKKGIEEILRLLDINFSDGLIDLSRDTGEILARFSPDLGEESLEAKFPHVAREWDYSRNGGLLPSQVGPGSHYRAWWKHEGKRVPHVWQARIEKRTRGKQSCPICQNRIIIPEENSFKACYPELMKDWDWSKNDIDPAMVSPRSSKEAYWVCHICGGEWKASIANRTREVGGNCPYCSGKRLVKGKNDLLTCCPEIAAEYHPSKNVGMPIEKVFLNSNKKVWWLCPRCGNEYEQSVNNKVAGWQGCPKCQGIWHISRSEKILFYYLGLSTGNDQVLLHARPELMGGREVDLFIPKKNDRNRM